MFISGGISTAMDFTGDQKNQRAGYEDHHENIPCIHKDLRNLAANVPAVADSYDWAERGRNDAMCNRSQVTCCVGESSRPAHSHHEQIGFLFCSDS